MTREKARLNTATTESLGGVKPGGTEVLNHAPQEKKARQEQQEEGRTTPS